MSSQKEQSNPDEVQQGIEILVAILKGQEKELSDVITKVQELTQKLATIDAAADKQSVLNEIKAELSKLQDDPFFIALGQYFSTNQYFPDFSVTLAFQKAKKVYDRIITKPLEDFSTALHAKSESLKPPVVKVEIIDAAYLPEIDGIKLPTVQELHRWINELMKVAANPAKPIAFDKEAFEHNPSPRVTALYVKWIDLLSDAQTVKEKGKLPAGYWEELRLIQAKIGYYNLYWDVQEPNGANNHAKIQSKILDGNAFQYGPLIGGQDQFDHLMSHFGLTEFKPIKPGSSELAHVRGDVTDTIRTKALEIFSGSYIFVCIDNGKLVNRSVEHQFRVGNMGGGRLGELQNAVRTGSFEHKGEKVFLIKKSSLKKDGKKIAIPLQVFDKTADDGKGAWVPLKRKDLFGGIEGQLFDKVPASKRQWSFETNATGQLTRKMRQEVFDLSWNLILLDLVDIAFIPKRARGSSLGHGNENITGGSIDIGGQRVPCMTDGLSFLAYISYEINNKTVTQSPQIDGIILYLPECFETTYKHPIKSRRLDAGASHPTASPDSPYRVTRFARDTFEYYRCWFEEKQITGNSCNFTPVQEIESDPVPEKPSVQIYDGRENDRLFWHFSFDKEQFVEFPSLSMALQRRYVDSTGSYYTALNGYLFMRNTLFEDLPPKLTENQVKDKMKNWMSNGCGKYKIIKGGAQEDWIRKTTRLYFTRLLHSYEHNTPVRFKNIGQVDSLVFEMVKPLWDATTVKDMSGSVEDFNTMKIDLVLDLFTPESTAKFRTDSGVSAEVVKKNRAELERHLQDDDEKELHKYLTSKRYCGFATNKRYFKYNRIGHIIAYNKRMWSKSNVAAPWFREVEINYQFVKQQWGIVPTHTPVPPRLLTEKGEKS